MFRFVIAALSCVAAVPAVAASCPVTLPPGTVPVTIEVTGVRSSAGEVAFTVYPDIKKRFLAKGGKPTILMCPPTFYTVEYAINPWMEDAPPCDDALAKLHPPAA